MNEILIATVVLIVLIFVFFAGRKEKVSQAEKDKEDRRSEKEAWSKEEVKSHGDIEATVEELHQFIEENSDSDNKDSTRFKELISEWAELKKTSFSERRSWVRSPNKDKDQEGKKDE